MVEAKLSEMEFWSLRMQVFLVDPRSATPITRLMYGKLTKPEVYELMYGFNQRAEVMMVKNISMNGKHLVGIIPTDPQLMMPNNF